MKFDQILKDLEKKIYYPVYFLQGDETYFIDEISDYIEKNVLSDSEKEFNQTVLYGRDVNVNTIISNAKRYPMMANYQVLIIKEAQNIQKIEELEPYILNPLKSTILVICFKYKKIDKRKTFAKNIGKAGVLFESPRLFDNQIPDWIIRLGKQNDITITPKASMLLHESTGSSLSKISNEISKIAINVPKGSEVNDAIIEEYIGISKDFNVFELQNALGERNVVKANQIINYFAANKKDNPIIKVIAIMYGFFNKLLLLYQVKDNSVKNIAAEISVHPFFVKDYLKAARNYSFAKRVEVIALLREYDLKAKGIGNSGTPDGELFKELIYRILH